jgi:hypothetical protein
MSHYSVMDACLTSGKYHSNRVNSELTALKFNLRDVPSCSIEYGAAYYCC